MSAGEVKDQLLIKCCGERSGVGKPWCIGAAYTLAADDDEEVDGLDAIESLDR